MGVAVKVTQSQRQSWLGALEGLALALLIDAQNQRVGGGIQIESDDVADLLDKEGIIGEFEGAKAVRLESKGAPDPLNGRLGDPGLSRHVPATPLGLGVGLLVQCFMQQPGDLFVGYAAGAARSQIVVQGLHAAGDESPAPLSDRGLRQAQPLGNLLVVDTLIGQQHNPHSGCQALGHRWRACQRLQLLPLLL